MSATLRLEAPSVPAAAPGTWGERFDAFREAHPRKHARIGAVDWEYLDGGRGRPLLFLTGGLGFAEASFETIGRLEREHRVLAPTYPALEHVDDAVDGLAGLLDVEGIEQADVFGHSLGAGLAHVLVRRHPERVDRLVLGSFGLYTRAHRLLVRAFLRLPERALVAYYRRAAARLTAEADPAEGAFLRGLVERALAPGGGAGGGLDRLRILVDLFERARTYRLHVPVDRPGRVLVLAASDDRGFSAAEREALIATYPGATVRIFRKGGHWVGMAQRAAYDETIDRFLGASEA